jgi:hypothetical protein
MKVSDQFHALVVSTPRKDVLVFTEYEASWDTAGVEVVENSKLIAPNLLQPFTYWTDGTREHVYQDLGSSSALHLWPRTRMPRVSYSIVTARSLVINLS